MSETHNLGRHIKKISSKGLIKPAARSLLSNTYLPYFFLQNHQVTFPQEYILKPNWFIKQTLPISNYCQKRFKPFYKCLLSFILYDGTIRSKNISNFSERKFRKNEKPEIHKIQILCISIHVLVILVSFCK